MSTSETRTPSGGPPGATGSRPGRAAVVLRARGLAWLVVLVGAVAAAGGEHPRLLLSAYDIERIRLTCGVGPAAEAAGVDARSRADLVALERRLEAAVGETVLPGEMLAAAFLHVIDPNDPRDAQRVALVSRALAVPLSPVEDALARVVALDWCWDALEPALRRELIASFRRRGGLLDSGSSPLDHLTFRRKLALLALVLVVDEQDEPGQAWARLRGEVLAAAREYFSGPFANYLRWRGHSPTGPAAAGIEENDTFWAIELAGLVERRLGWQRYGPVVARWLEHYLLEDGDYGPTAHQFLHDDGTTAPLLPLSSWEGLLPSTAHLLAGRTYDPAAATLCDRIERRLRAADAGAAAAWRWMPLVFEGARVAGRVDLARLPAVRNLDGVVILRSTRTVRPTVIWIDAGQPFLRRGQHFDAGHFLLRSSGHLVVAGGADVANAATLERGGRQGLGRAGRFDFEQYFTAGIAHNCMIFWEKMRAWRWYGRLYRPLGGPRPREDTCRDLTTPLDQQGRSMGRLVAYGACDEAAYVALDLTAAYDPRSVRRYWRRFLLLGGRALFVIDSYELASRRVRPRWVLNVPARPQVDGQPLDGARRVAGRDDQAGIWRYPALGWLHWHDHDGRISLVPLWPPQAEVTIVGGPARRLSVERGPARGRRYQGGDPDGFEHLIAPADCAEPANAWYRLGDPGRLGEHFGVRAHWGRIELVAPADAGLQHVVAVLFVEHDGLSAPAVWTRRAGGGFELGVRFGTHELSARLADDGTGWVTLGPGGGRWELPTTVLPDPPLPLRRAGGGN